MEAIWKVKSLTKRKNFKQLGNTGANKCQEENVKAIKYVSMRDNKSQDNSNSKKQPKKTGNYEKKKNATEKKEARKPKKNRPIK